MRTPEQEVVRIVKMFHEITASNISMLDYEENKVVVYKCAIRHVKGIMENNPAIKVVEDTKKGALVYYESTLENWQEVLTILENK